MNKWIDETGNKYGYFEVLSRVKESKNPVKWTCKCLNCGKLKEVSGIKLRNCGVRCVCTKRKVSVDVRKNKVNDLFFEENDLETFYWAGFIAADGCIFFDKIIQISLNNKDVKLLERFKEVTKFTGRVIVYDRGVCTIKINSPLMVKSLKERFSITSRKSLILEFPDINSWTLEQLDSFILGYIDGDGCIYLGNRNLGNVNLSILGTEKFLNVIRNRFNTILNKIVPNVRKRTSNISVIEVSGIKAINLLKHFYELSCYKLSRKWSDRLKHRIFNYARITEQKIKIEEYPKILKKLENGISIKDLANEYQVSKSSLRILVKNLKTREVKDWNILIKLHKTMNKRK